MTGECLRFGECFIVNTDEGYVAQLGDLETEPHESRIMAIADLSTQIVILITRLSDSANYLRGVKWANAFAAENKGDCESCNR